MENKKDLIDFLLTQKIKKVYTADDEEPNCNLRDCYDSCDGTYCGPEYGWWKYKRTEIIKKEKE